jgi:hypothetical protein
MIQAMVARPYTCGATSCPAARIVVLKWHSSSGIVCAERDRLPMSLTISQIKRNVRLLSRARFRAGLYAIKARATHSPGHVAPRPELRS